MAKTFIFCRSAGMLLAFASSVSSCTLIDPHRTTLSAREANAIILEAQKCPSKDDFDPKTGRVAADKLDAVTAKMDGLSPYCQYYGQLPAVIAYAYAQSEEFDGAISSQSVLKNGIALGVIPAAAAGLFLGIQGGHTDALLALASGSAAALGLGSFLSSEPRQAVYSSGSLALACSIVKVSPYLVDNDEYTAIGTDFTDALAAMDRDIPTAADLTGQLAALDVEISDLVLQIRAKGIVYNVPGNTSELQKTAVSSIASAELAVADASGLRPKVLAARMKIDQASITLEQAVHNIAEQVSREVTKTEPDINTIRALAAQIAPGVQAQIAGINDARKAIIPPAPAPAAPPNVGAQPAAAPAAAAAQPDPLVVKADKLVEDRQEVQNALLAVLDRLDKNTFSLRRSIVLVQPLIDSIASREQKAAAVPDCIVEAAQVGFTISPPVTELSMKVGETKGIVVNGAVGNAAGTTVSGAGDGIDFKTTGNGTGLLVNMTGKKPGNYVVAITDSTGKGTKTINVAVATGLTLKSGGKDVGDTLEIAKATDVDIAIAGGSGPISTFVPGTQKGGLNTTKTTGDSASGSVTINAPAAGSFEITIKAGDEQRTLKVTAK